MKNHRFLRLYHKQTKIEKQLIELEENNKHEVVYDYDDYGNRNGYILVFENAIVNKKYCNLCKRLCRIFDKLSKF